MSEGLTKANDRIRGRGALDKKNEEKTLGIRWRARIRDKALERGRKTRGDLRMKKTLNQAGVRMDRVKRRKVL